MKSQKSLGNYKIGKLLGSGAFSKVRLATHIITGEKFAVKIIEKKLIREQKEKEIKRNEEAERSRKLRERKKMHKLSAKSNVMEANSVKEIVPIDTQVLASSPASASTPLLAGAAGKPDFGKFLLNLTEMNQEFENEIITAQPPERKESTFLPDIQKEVKLLMLLNHPNIIKIFEIYDSPDETFIIMDLAKGGEMMNYIITREVLSEKESRHFFRQIMSAVAHVHQAHIVHRDLKLENILLSEKMTCLITDFGLGRTFETNNMPDMETFCGTPNYASYELITGNLYNGVKNDIWALGVILYICLTGKRPFVGSTIQILRQRMAKLDYEIPSNFSPELISLLKSIFVLDPKLRIDVEGIRDHPWLNIGFEEKFPLYPVLWEHEENFNTGNTIKGIGKSSEFTVYTIVNPSSLLSSAHSLGSNHSRARSTSVANAFRYTSSRSSVQSVPTGVSNNLYGEIKPYRTASIKTHWQGMAGAKSGGIEFENLLLRPSTVSVVGESMHKGTDSIKNWSIYESEELETNGKDNHGVRSNARLEFAGPMIEKVMSENSGRVFNNNNLTQLSSLNPNYNPNPLLNPSVSKSNTIPSFSEQLNLPVVIPSEGTNQTNEEEEPDILSPLAVVSPTTMSHRKRSSSASVQTNTTRTVTSNHKPNYRLEQKAEDWEENEIQAAWNSSGPSMAPTLKQKTESMITTENAISLEPEREIMEWHAIHKPASMIRPMRFSFNRGASTSVFEPPLIFQDLHAALLNLAAASENFTLTFTRTSPLYIFNCNVTYLDKSNVLEFEAEVCKVWLLRIHGVRFKRIRGDAFDFKQMRHKIVDCFNYKL